MAQRKQRLKKELSLLSVFTIAAGTTLSAGFFLLPGIAAQQAGPAMVLAYVLAAVPLVPATFSVIELATAMPRAGGVYFFLDRSLGPYAGTIGGIGTWLALVLKVSFALVGVGVYLSAYVPNLSIKPVAVGAALLLGMLNYLGAKKTGGLQNILVVGLLAILALFIGTGLPHLNPDHFSGIFDVAPSALMSTTGLVYISYVGMTKVASLSEEVKDPERNLPLGVMLALGTAVVIYAMGTTVMVGVVPIHHLAGDLSPVLTAARATLGTAGGVMVTVAALFAFLSVANAGTLSASRYPLAMSRDHIVPPAFGRMARNGAPYLSLLVTVGAVIGTVLFLDPTKIAKLASAFQLLMFALVCAAVVVMRESRIPSYDPGYRSPGYPWMQLAGIAIPVFLIYEMGVVPTLFSLGMMAVATAWYFGYARHRVVREGAIYHVFERLGQRRYDELDSELRGIMKEKGLRRGDPFDEIVARAMVLDLPDKMSFEEVASLASEHFAEVSPHPAREYLRRFLDGNRIGATPVARGIALPHLHVDGVERPEMVLARARAGVDISVVEPVSGKAHTETVTAVFFLVSPEADPAQHLRILARIAGRVEEPSFAEQWRHAEDCQQLKEALIRDDRFISLSIREGTPTETLAGQRISDIELPPDCLIAIIRRDQGSLVPRGDTVLALGDRLTILGDPRSLEEVRSRWGGASGEDATSSRG